MVNRPAAAHAELQVLSADLEVKAARRKWNPALHPRDHRGRFIETGGTVRLWGGKLARVVRALPNDRILVQDQSATNEFRGRRHTTSAKWVTMVARPDGTAPTDDEDKVAAEDEKRRKDPRRGNGLARDDDGDPNTPNDPHDIDDQGRPIGDDDGDGPDDDEDEPADGQHPINTAALPNKRHEKGSRFKDVAAVRQHFNQLAAQPGTKPDMARFLRAIAEDDDLVTTRTGGLAVLRDDSTGRWYLTATGTGQRMDAAGDFGSPREASQFADHLAQTTASADAAAPGGFDFSNPDLDRTAGSWRSAKGENIQAAITRARTEFDATPRPAAKKTTAAKPKTASNTGREGARFPTIATLRDHWRSLAAELSDTDLHGNALRRMAEDPKIQLSRSGEFVVDKHGEWRLSSTASGHVLPHSNFSRKTDALAFAEFIRGRLKDKNGQALDFSAPDLVDRITNWQSSDGEPISVTWLRARADFDTSRGLDDSEAIRKYRLTRPEDEQRGEAGDGKVWANHVKPGDWVKVPDRDASGSSRQRRTKEHEVLSAETNANGQVVLTFQEGGSATFNRNDKLDTAPGPNVQNADGQEIGERVSRRRLQPGDLVEVPGVAATWNVGGASGLPDGERYTIRGRLHPKYRGDGSSRLVEPVITDSSGKRHPVNEDWLEDSIQLPERTIRLNDEEAEREKNRPAPATDAAPPAPRPENTDGPATVSRADLKAGDRVTITVGRGDIEWPHSTRDQDKPDTVTVEGTIAAGHGINGTWAPLLDVTLTRPDGTVMTTGDNAAIRHMPAQATVSGHDDGFTPEKTRADRVRVGDVIADGFGRVVTGIDRYPGGRTFTTRNLGGRGEIDQFGADPGHTLNVVPRARRRPEDVARHSGGRTQAHPASGDARVAARGAISDWSKANELAGRQWPDGAPEEFRTLAQHMQNITETPKGPEGYQQNADAMRGALAALEDLDIENLDRELQRALLQLEGRLDDNVDRFEADAREIREVRQKKATQAQQRVQELQARPPVAGLDNDQLRAEQTELASARTSYETDEIAKVRKERLAAIEAELTRRETAETTPNSEAPSAAEPRLTKAQAAALDSALNSPASSNGRQVDAPPSVVKVLVRHGYAEQRSKPSASGRGRTVSYYVLTPEGERRARALREERDKGSQSTGAPNAAEGSGDGSSTDSSESDEPYDPREDEQIDPETSRITRFRTPQGVSRNIGGRFGVGEPVGSRFGESYVVISENPDGSVNVRHAPPRWEEPLGRPATFRPDELTSNDGYSPWQPDKARAAAEETAPDGGGAPSTVILSPDEVSEQLDSIRPEGSKAPSTMTDPEIRDEIVALVERDMAGDLSGADRTRLQVLEAEEARRAGRKPKEEPKPKRKQPAEGMGGLFDVDGPASNEPNRSADLNNPDDRAPDEFGTPDMFADAEGRDTTNLREAQLRAPMELEVGDRFLDREGRAHTVARKPALTGRRRVLVADEDGKEHLLPPDAEVRVLYPDEAVPEAPATDGPETPEGDAPSAGTAESDAPEGDSSASDGPGADEPENDDAPEGGAPGQPAAPRPEAETGGTNPVGDREPVDMSTDEIENEIDGLEDVTRALEESTDPLELAFRLRAERRLWALQREEADRWEREPEYDKDGKLVEPSRGSILLDRVGGYGLNQDEARGAVSTVDELPPAKPGGYSDADWERIETQASAGEAYPPTDEQRVIIEGAARRGLDMRVMALAGTGKSTTLKMLSRRMPDKRILYLAFNRSVADEAIESQQRGEYGKNLTPTTANAYANSMVDRDLLDRLKWPRLNDQQLADRMRSYEPIPAGGDSLSPRRAAHYANRLLAEWVKSDDDDFAVHHLPEELRNREAVFAAVKPLAERMWANITDPKAKDKDRDLPLSFDHTVKMWALSRRVPDTDVLFWDEAQDVNPVMEGIVRNIRAAGIQVVAVGDSNQAIYGFRGATDALGRLPADATATLTQTFRFGDAVADAGNRFLRLVGTRMRLKGWDRKNSRTGEIHPGDETMLIARTNAGVVLGAVEGLQAGRKVAVSGGLNDLRKFLEAAEALRDGKRTSHQDLAQFNGMAWDDIREEVSADKNLKQLDSMFKLMERHNDALEALLNAVRMPRPLVEDDGEHMWVKLAFGDRNFATTKEWLKRQGFGWDPVSKRWGYPPPKKGNHVPEDERARVLQKVEQYIADRYTAPASSSGGQIVDQAAPHDLLVSTAHKAKGLESERVRIAGDFFTPKETPEGGIDWDTIPGDEELRLAYVAVTRATDVLDTGSLGWIYQVTRGDDPMEEPDGDYTRDWEISDFQAGDSVTFWSEDGESVLAGTVSAIDGVELRVRTEDGRTTPITSSRVVRRNGQDQPRLDVASPEELDAALSSGQFVPPQSDGTVRIPQQEVNDTLTRIRPEATDGQNDDDSSDSSTGSTDADNAGGGGDGDAPGSTATDDGDDDGDEESTARMLADRLPQLPELPKMAGLSRQQKEDVRRIRSDYAEIQQSLDGILAGEPPTGDAREDLRRVRQQLDYVATRLNNDLLPDSDEAQAARARLYELGQDLDQALGAFPEREPQPQGEGPNGGTLFHPWDLQDGDLVSFMADDGVNSGLAPYYGIFRGASSTSNGRTMVGYEGREWNEDRQRWEGRIRRHSVVMPPRGLVERLTPEQWDAWRRPEQSDTDDSAGSEEIPPVPLGDTPPVAMSDDEIAAELEAVEAWRQRHVVPSGEGPHVPRSDLSPTVSRIGNRRGALLEAQNQRQAIRRREEQDAQRAREKADALARAEVGKKTANGSSPVSLDGEQIGTVEKLGSKWMYTHADGTSSGAILKSKAEAVAALVSLVDFRRQQEEEAARNDTARSETPDGWVLGDRADVAENDIIRVPRMRQDRDGRPYPEGWSEPVRVTRVERRDDGTAIVSFRNLDDSHTWGTPLFLRGPDDTFAWASDRTRPEPTPEWHHELRARMADIGDDIATLQSHSEGIDDQDRMQRLQDLVQRVKEHKSDDLQADLRRIVDETAWLQEQFDNINLPYETWRTRSWASAAHNKAQRALEHPDFQHGSTDAPETGGPDNAPAVDSQNAAAPDAGPRRFSSVDEVRDRWKRGDLDPAPHADTALAPYNRGVRSTDADTSTLELSEGGRLAILQASEDVGPVWSVVAPGSMVVLARAYDRDDALAQTRILEGVRDADGNPFPWDAPDAAERALTFRGPDGESLGTAVAQRVASLGESEGVSRRWQEEAQKYLDSKRALSAYYDEWRTRQEADGYTIPLNPLDAQAGDEVTVLEAYAGPYGGRPRTAGVTNRARLEEPARPDPLGQGAAFPFLVDSHWAVRTAETPELTDEQAEETQRALTRSLRFRNAADRPEAFRRPRPGERTPASQSGDDRGAVAERDEFAAVRQRYDGDMVPASEVRLGDWVHTVSADPAYNEPMHMVGRVIGVTPVLSNGHVRIEVEANVKVRGADTVRTEFAMIRGTDLVEQLPEGNPGREDSSDLARRIESNNRQRAASKERVPEGWQAVDGSQVQPRPGDRFRIVARRERGTAPEHMNVTVERPAERDGYWRVQGQPLSFRPSQIVAIPDGSDARDRDASAPETGRPNTDGPDNAPGTDTRADRARELFDEGMNAVGGDSLPEMQELRDRLDGADNADDRDAELRDIADRMDALAEQYELAGPQGEHAADRFRRAARIARGEQGQDDEQQNNEDQDQQGQNDPDDEGAQGQDDEEDNQRRRDGDPDGGAADPDGGADNSGADAPGDGDGSGSNGNGPGNADDEEDGRDDGDDDQEEDEEQRRRRRRRRERDGGNGGPGGGGPGGPGLPRMNMPDSDTPTPTGEGGNGDGDGGRTPARHRDVDSLRRAWKNGDGLTPAENTPERRAHLAELADREGLALSPEGGLAMWPEQQDDGSTVWRFAQARNGTNLPGIALTSNDPEEARELAARFEDLTDRSGDLFDWNQPWGPASITAWRDTEGRSLPQALRAVMDDYEQERAGASTLPEDLTTLDDSELEAALMRGLGPEDAMRVMAEMDRRDGYVDERVRAAMGDTPPANAEQAEREGKAMDAALGFGGTDVTRSAPATPGNLRREFDALDEERFQAATDATGGRFLSPEAEADGVDPREVFSGRKYSNKRAKELASEELRIWFDGDEETATRGNGRLTYEQYRQQQTDRALWEEFNDWDEARRRQAADYTRGIFVKPQYYLGGPSETVVFSGGSLSSRDRWREYASDELVEWFDANGGRITFNQWKQQHRAGNRRDREEFEERQRLAAEAGEGNTTALDVDSVAPAPPYDPERPETLDEGAFRYRGMYYLDGFADRAELRPDGDGGTQAVWLDGRRIGTLSIHSAEPGMDPVWDSRPLFGLSNDRAALARDQNLAVANLVVQALREGPADPASPSEEAWDSVMLRLAGTDRALPELPESLRDTPEARDRYDRLGALVDAFRDGRSLNGDLRNDLEQARDDFTWLRTALADEGGQPEDLSHLGARAAWAGRLLEGFTPDSSRGRPGNSDDQTGSTDASSTTPAPGGGTPDPANPDDGSRKPEQPETPEPIGGQPAHWARVEDLVPGDMVRMDGTTRKGKPLQRAGYVYKGPELVDVTRRGRTTQEWRTWVTENPDGTGDGGNVYTTANATAARAEAPDDVVPGSPATGAQSAVQTGNMPERIPADRNGRALFPGSTVTGVRGVRTREGTVTGATDTTVSVRWGDDTEDGVSPASLTVTDGARPDGWTPDGHQVRPGQVVTDADGALLGPVDEVKGDSVTISTMQGTTTRSAGDLRVTGEVRDTAPDTQPVTDIDQPAAADVKEGDVIVLDLDGVLATVAVTSTDRDGDRVTIDYADTTTGEIGSIDMDATAILTRAKGPDGNAPELGPDNAPNKPEDLTVHEPPHPVTPVTGTTVDPNLTEGDRDIIDDHASGPDDNPDAQQAAARIAADLPVTPEQAAALAAQLRESADPSTTEGRAALRAADHLDQAAGRTPPAGFDRPRPSNAAQVGEGDLVAMPDERNGDRLGIFRVIDAEDGPGGVRSFLLEDGDRQWRRRIVHGAMPVWQLPEPQPEPVTPPDIDPPAPAAPATPDTAGAPTPSAPSAPAEPSVPVAQVRPGNLRAGDVIDAPVSRAGYQFNGHRRLTIIREPHRNGWWMQLTGMDEDGNVHDFGLHSGRAVNVYDRNRPTPALPPVGDPRDPNPTPQNTADAILRDNARSLRARIREEAIAGTDPAGDIHALREQIAQRLTPEALREIRGAAQQDGLAALDAVGITGRDRREARQRMRDARRDAHTEEVRAILRTINDLEPLPGESNEDLAARARDLLRLIPDGDDTQNGQDGDGEVTRTVTGHVDDAVNALLQQLQASGVDPGDAERIARTLTRQLDGSRQATARRIARRVAAVSPGAARQPGLLARIVAFLIRLAKRFALLVKAGARKIAEKYRTARERLRSLRAFLGRMVRRARQWPEARRLARLHRAVNLPDADGDSLAGRISHWAGLMPEPGRFGQAQRRVTFWRPTTWGQLAAGRLPGTSDRIQWAPDRAADGGPGLAALRHMAALRAAGSDVDQDVTRRLAAVLGDNFGDDPHATLQGADDYVATSERRLVNLQAARSGATIPDDPDLEIEIDAARMELSTARREYADLRAQYAAAVPDAVAAALADIRDVGTGGNAGIVFGPDSTPDAERAVRGVQRVLPRSWLASGEVRRVTAVDGDEGRYEPSGQRITVADLADEGLGTAGHALAQHLARHIGDLDAAQRAFWFIQTHTGRPGARRMRPSALERLLRRQQTQPETGDSLARSIQAMFSGDWYQDDDLRAFLLGLMATR